MKLLWIDPPTHCGNRSCYPLTDLCHPSLHLISWNVSSDCSCSHLFSCHLNFSCHLSTRLKLSSFSSSQLLNSTLESSQLLTAFLMSDLFSPTQCGHTEVVLTGTVKARCSIEVVAGGVRGFPVNFHTKSLLRSAHVHFDCAA